MMKLIGSTPATLSSESVITRMIQDQIGLQLVLLPLLKLPLIKVTE